MKEEIFLLKIEDMKKKQKLLINKQKFLKRLKELKNWDEKESNLNFIKKQVLEMRELPYVYFVEEDQYSLEWDSFGKYDYIEINVNFNEKKFCIFYSVDLNSDFKFFDFGVNLKEIIEEVL